MRFTDPNARGFDKLDTVLLYSSGVVVLRLANAIAFGDAAPAFIYTFEVALILSRYASIFCES